MRRNLAQWAFVLNFLNSVFFYILYSCCQVCPSLSTLLGTPGLPMSFSCSTIKENVTIKAEYMQLFSSSGSFGFQVLNKTTCPILSGFLWSPNMNKIHIHRFFSVKCNITGSMPDDNFSPVHTAVTTSGIIKVG